MVQLIRYTESPVGPYDEFILVPGNFSWTKEDKDGRRITGHHPKITRIYVSQKHTCYNGRKSESRALDFIPHEERRCSSIGR